mgnify:CR=1 FL=1
MTGTTQPPQPTVPAPAPAAKGGSTKLLLIILIVLLLVGMGNPLQETWIDRWRERLGVPVAIGVGGLFDHWGGNLRRAAPWVRRLGIEWVQILLQQPGRKWRRYLVGNPLFLARALRDRSTSRASGS